MCSDIYIYITLWYPLQDIRENVLKKEQMLKKTFYVYFYAQNVLYFFIHNNKILCIYLVFVWNDWYRSNETLFYISAEFFV